MEKTLLCCVSTQKSLLVSAYRLLARTGRVASAYWLELVSGLSLMARTSHVASAYGLELVMWPQPPYRGGWEMPFFCCNRKSNVEGLQRHCLFLQQEIKKLHKITHSQSFKVSVRVHQEAWQEIKPKANKWIPHVLHLLCPEQSETLSRDSHSLVLNSRLSMA